MAKAPTEIKSLARAHTDTAINVLARIMQQDSAPPSARVAASQALLDRGWGKPAQAIVGGDEDDAPVRLERIERVIIKAPDQNG
jgi:hypothetical protein